MLDGDERDVALAGDVAEPLLDARRGKAMPSPAHDFDGDEFTRLGAILMTGLHLQFTARLLVDGNDARPLPLGMAEYAEDAGISSGKLADDAGVIRKLRILAGFELGQHTVADGGRLGFIACSSSGLRHDEDLGRSIGCVFIPLGRRGDQFAISVAAGDFEDGDRRQFARLCHDASRALELAVLLQRLEQTLECYPVIARDIEGPGDFALADLSGAILDEFDELFGRGQFGWNLLRLPRHGSTHSLCLAGPASCCAWQAWQRPLPP